MNKKIKAARVSIISNAVLTLGKFTVGIVMGSVSVISEAIHSGLDLIAAMIAFFSVRESSKPADANHNYGHGKFENVASIVEAILILVAAAMIIFNAYPKLFRGTEISSLGLGAAVMAVSAVVNLFVSRMLMRTARETDSPALAADAWHLRTDVYTSAGVFAGIIAIKITGLTILDPLIGIGVALLIIKAGVDLIRDSMRSILDVRLPKEEVQKIGEVLEKYAVNFVEFHQLRTRKAGSQRYIDLHLVVPQVWDIKTVHILCDRIEEDIRDEFKDAHILIHSEPCGQNCVHCSHRDLCKAGLEDQDVPCKVCKEFDQDSFGS
jgi:cation diffusion facilitator family transporter